jgi:hypothetical protein
MPRYVIIDEEKGVNLDMTDPKIEVMYVGDEGYKLPVDLFGKKFDVTLRFSYPEDEAKHPFRALYQLNNVPFIEFDNDPVKMYGLILKRLEDYIVE